MQLPWRGRQEGQESVNDLRRGSLKQYETYQQEQRTETWLVIYGS